MQESNPLRSYPLTAFKAARHHWPIFLGQVDGTLSRSRSCLSRRRHRSYLHCTPTRGESES